MTWLIANWLTVLVVGLGAGSFVSALLLLAIMMLRRSEED